ncbi:MAG: lyase family protein [Gaiella sp.]|nr:lyase family protein [Gaiella sp.]
MSDTAERKELWGGETAKAIGNFPVSGEPIPIPVARWLGRIKAAAARVNADLGLLDTGIAGRIAAAGDRIAAGELDDQFPIDVFQTGSGTSSNMNANEVIASLAGEDVHPNDHVNMGQSSNDVFPSAVHLAALGEIAHDLLPALERLAASLERKAFEFDGVVKSGRTHWMDAVPVTLGQEFAGYAAQIRQGDRARRRRDAAPRPDPARRDGHRHGAQHTPRVRFPCPRVPLARHRSHGLGSCRPLRGPGGTRRARRGIGRAQGRRRLADEDRERPPLHGLGPACGGCPRSSSPSSRKARRSCRAR